MADASSTIVSAYATDLLPFSLIWKFRDRLIIDFGNFINKSQRAVLIWERKTQSGRKPSRLRIGDVALANRRLCSYGKNDTMANWLGELLQGDGPSFLFPCETIEEGSKFGFGFSFFLMQPGSRHEQNFLIRQEKNLYWVGMTDTRGFDYIRVRRSYPLHFSRSLAKEDRSKQLKHCSME